MGEAERSPMADQTRPLLSQFRGVVRERLQTGPPLRFRLSMSGGCVHQDPWQVLPIDAACGTVAMIHLPSPNPLLAPAHLPVAAAGRSRA